MQNFDEFTDRLRREVAEAEIEHVVKQLFDLLEPLENERLKEIVIIKNKMVRLRTEELRGGLGFSESERTRTQICSNLLEIIHLIERDHQIIAHFNTRYLYLIPTLGPEKIVARITSQDARVARPSYDLNSSIVIGRHDTCDIIINEVRISRQHTRLFVQNERIFVQDLGSKNKTYINDTHITSPLLLPQSAELRLYNVVFHIELL